MRVRASLVAATLLLAGCGGGEEDKKAGAATLAKGQTVATVDGKDVTVHELNAELAGVDLPQGEQRKQVEQAALQSVIGRTILAGIARERGLEKSPNFLIQQRRANDNLLVQLLRGEIAGKLPPPTRQDALTYMQQNPDVFAQRKIYTLDQIQFPVPADLSRLKRLEPLTTMEQVEQQLIQDRVEYRRGDAKLDTVGTNPQLLRQIGRLPPGEIFVFPQGGAVIASRITGAEVQPFTGEQAEQYAMNMVQNQRMEQAVERELKARVEQARKTVQYQKGYAPPAAPKQQQTAAAPAKAS